MTEPVPIRISSETSPLEAVILHRPGPEVENMTPANAERALYSDILNLSVASEEYDQLKGVLDKVSRTFEVRELLCGILENDRVKEELVRRICCNEEICQAADTLLDLPALQLAGQLIEGVPLVKDNLTRYLSSERYLLKPLHNLFFTRDIAMVVNDRIMSGRMANRVRERESLIMEAIFTHHPLWATPPWTPEPQDYPTPASSRITIEGGDFLVARDDVFIIGTGVRTSTQGIDFFISKICAATPETRHIIVQELPAAPESFIHLDMIFTLLDRDACMVYEPVVFELNRYKTIHIETDNGRVRKIEPEANILTALKKLGMDLEPITCGGKSDRWVQEREQWHSGANFFAFAPGMVIGYARNIHTLSELNRYGFEIITAREVIRGTRSPWENERCVITIAGSELARGGGGARCMTLPVGRKG